MAETFCQSVGNLIIHVSLMCFEENDLLKNYITIMMTMTMTITMKLFVVSSKDATFEFFR